MSSPAAEDANLHTDRAHNARAYDYLLGGKDNYAADRAMADAALAVFPGARISARSNRAFMHRASRRLAQAGLTQFLDIGTGIPTEPNLHQVVQEVVPQASIVYVDNDPIVLAHAAALMVGDPRGRTAYLQADARDPGAILRSPQVTDNLDLRRPVAVSLIALLHFLDDDAATRLVTAIVAAVAPGSHLTISHGTLAADRDGRFAAAVARYAEAGVHMYPRAPADLERLFLSGLEILDPGVVMSHRWHPDPPTGTGELGELVVVEEVDDADVAGLAVTARIP